jgi:hypothetical protein
MGDGAAAHARWPHHGVRLLIFSFRRNNNGKTLASLTRLCFFQRAAAAFLVISDLW